MTAKLIFLIVGARAIQFVVLAIMDGKPWCPCGKKKLSDLSPAARVRWAEVEEMSRGNVFGMRVLGGRPAIGGVSPPLTGSLACHWLPRCRRPWGIQFRIAERYLKTPSRI